MVMGLSGDVPDSADVVAASRLSDLFRPSLIRYFRRRVNNPVDAEDLAQVERAILALADMPDRTRQIFVYRRIDGLSFLEIAARLGISVSAVEKHMVRAMRHLMQKVGKQQ